ncbi:MAG: branched-chain amino acid ABC transporter permease [Candidatus Bathyarchaeia archaeon]
MEKEDISRYNRNKLAYLGLLAAIFLILAPNFFGAYLTHVLTMSLFFGYLGLAWNILGGYAGQFSFGHAAFFGIGAYTSTLLQIHYDVNPWFGLVCAGIAGAFLGLFVGYLCFRYGLKGPYFALAILAFAEMLRLLATQWMSLRYPLGISIPLKGDSLLAFQFKSKVPYFYISLFMTSAMIWITRYIERRKLGLYFKAIRENEEAAEALGINVFKYKLIAMLLSAFFTAIGGTFYSQYYLIIEEESTFGTGVSVSVLLGPLIGGIGTVAGPLIGGAVLEFLSEMTRNLLGAYSGVHLMIYGGLLILVILFLPHGIWGGLRSLVNRSTSRGFIKNGPP